MLFVCGVWCWDVGVGLVIWIRSGACGGFPLSGGGRVMWHQYIDLSFILNLGQLSPPFIVFMLILFIDCRLQIFAMFSLFFFPCFLEHSFGAHIYWAGFSFLEVGFARQNKKW